MQDEIPKEECSYCGGVYDLVRFAYIVPKSPDCIEQCHPFMDMLFVCPECVEAHNVAMEDQLREGDFEDEPR